MHDLRSASLRYVSSVCRLCTNCNICRCSSEKGPYHGSILPKAVHDVMKKDSLGSPQGKTENGAGSV